MFPWRQLRFYNSSSSSPLCLFLLVTSFSDICSFSRKYFMMKTVDREVFGLSRVFKTHCSRVVLGWIKQSMSISAWLDATRGAVIPNISFTRWVFNAVLLSVEPWNCIFSHIRTSFYCKTCNTWKWACRVNENKCVTGDCCQSWVSLIRADKDG